MIAAIFLACSLLGQEAPDKPAAGPDPLALASWHLATNRSVLRELGASEEQARALAALVPVLEARHKAVLSLAARQPRDRRREMMHAQLAESIEEFGRVMRRVLTPEQVRRYGQLSLRSQGLDAFAAGHVRPALKLTVEQQARLGDLEATLRAAMFKVEGQEANPEAREAAFAAAVALDRKLVREFEALLSPEQRATWKALAGEPFELEEDPVVEPR